MIAVMHLALKHFSQKTALNHCVIGLFSIEVKEILCCIRPRLCDYVP